MATLMAAVASMVTKITTAIWATISRIGVSAVMTKTELMSTRAMNEPSMNTSPWAKLISSMIP